MSAAKHGKGSVPSKKATGFGYLVVKDLVPAKGKANSISVRKNRPTVPRLIVKKSSMKTLEGRPRLVGKILDRIAEASLHAERLGESINLKIEITPNKAEPKITSLPSSRVVPNNALAAAKERGEQYVANLMRDPEMLPGREFASLIGMSPETVNQRRKTGDLLGLEGATRGIRFPKWQITDNGQPLPGLKAIFSILDNDPWAVFRFLRQPHNELAGKTALEEMKAGHIEEVENAARNLKDGVFA